MGMLRVMVDFLKVGGNHSDAVEDTGETGSHPSEFIMEVNRTLAKAVCSK